MFEGKCFGCGKSKEVDEYGFCERCEENYAKEQEERENQSMTIKLPKNIKEEIEHYRKTRIPRCPDCKIDLIKTKSTKVQGKEIASVWENDCECNKRKMKLCIG